jgi:large subunit ribosomal protein L25
MTTDRPALAADSREITGKAVAHLRRDGKLPAVVYGHGVASTSLTVDAHDFELLRRSVGANAIVDLSVDGKKAKPVLIHQIQVHPVTRRTLHVDLYQVKMTEELTVDVPLVPAGEAPAVDLGGTYLQLLDTVKVKALPDKLPQTLVVPTDSLVDYDAVLHVRDLEIPADVTLVTDPEEVLAKVMPPRVEVEPVEGEGAEGEGAEGEAAEGEAAEGEAASAAESESSEA